MSSHVLSSTVMRMRAQQLIISVNSVTFNILSLDANAVDQIFFKQTLRQTTARIFDLLGLW
jgi:hypothetical protein